MLFWRHKLARLLDGGGVVVYPMVDASPQGGKDWELMTLHMVARRSLPELQANIVLLEKMKLLTLQERVDQMADEALVMDKLEQAIICTMPPPVLIGVGKSRSSLALKFRACLHAFMLIAGQGAHLQKFIRSIHSWVTDYGTEVVRANKFKVCIAHAVSNFKR